MVHTIAKETIKNHEKMKQARAQLMEWIIFKDYGTKDTR